MAATARLREDGKLSMLTDPAFKDDKAFKVNCAGFPARENTVHLNQPSIRIRSNLSASLRI